VRFAFVLSFSLEPPERSKKHKIVLIATMIYPIYPVCILNALPLTALSTIENQFRKSDTIERAIPTVMILRLHER